MLTFLPTVADTIGLYGGMVGLQRLLCAGGFYGRMRGARADGPGLGAYAMLRQVLLGGGVSVVNIVIHAVAMLVIVHGGRKLMAFAQTSLVARVVNAMVASVLTVVILMLAHFAEIVVWSLAYAAIDVAPPGTDLLYFAFVNYTTLGYGDVVPAERWRLIGPITALNGVMMIGWSTAVIFEVMRVAVRGTVR